MTPSLLLAVTENDLRAGPLGLLVVCLIAVATFFLVRNMAGRIKRLPPSFPDERHEPRDDDKQAPPA